MGKVMGSLISFLQRS